MPKIWDVVGKEKAKAKGKVYVRSTERKKPERKPKVPLEPLLGEVLK